MDQSLEVFPDSFHSFYIFWDSKMYKSTFFCEKIFLGAFLSNRSARVYELVQVT